jgi:uncharacterized membrane protein
MIWGKTMKNRIMLIIICLLVGTLIALSVFWMLTPRKTMIIEPPMTSDVSTVLSVR